MNGEDRAELRRRIDQARRELVGSTAEDCGEAASTTSYWRGCRCESCRAASNADRTRRRHANIEHEREYKREYRRRKREARQATA